MSLLPLNLLVWPSAAPHYDPPLVPPTSQGQGLHLPAPPRPGPPSQVGRRPHLPQTDTCRADAAKNVNVSSVGFPRRFLCIAKNVDGRRPGRRDPPSPPAYFVPFWSTPAEGIFSLTKSERDILVGQPAGLLFSNDIDNPVNSSSGAGQMGFRLSITNRARVREPTRG